MNTLNFPIVPALQRSGMVRLDGFDDPEFLALLDYLSAREIEPVSPGPQHWSRRWEYPFAMHGIYHWLEKFGQPARIFEAGCGVTGMPFWLARLGHHVVGGDLDENCVLPWKARKINGSGKAEFFIENMEKLSFGDSCFDVAYSISAIEHTPRPDRAVSEMCRVLRPGGLLLLTCDVEPHGSIGIRHGPFMELLNVLDRETDLLFPPMWSHPSEILTFKTRPDDKRSKLHRWIARATHRLRRSGVRFDGAIYMTARTKKIPSNAAPSAAPVPAT
jgi:SAM-dependent methyltransferase